MRPRVPAAAGGVRAARGGLRLVQSGDAGARRRGAGRRRIPRHARAAVRHVPADPPPRVGGHAGARVTWWRGAALAAGALLLAATPARARVLWSGDFETGD